MNDVDAFARRRKSRERSPISFVFLFDLTSGGDKVVHVVTKLYQRRNNNIFMLAAVTPLIPDETAHGIRDKSALN